MLSDYVIVALVWVFGNFISFQDNTAAAERERGTE